MLVVVEGMELNQDTNKEFLDHRMSCHAGIL
jgi:hypothetical protein